MSIRSCTCVSVFQDQRYGKGQRVHTEGKNDKCTVCGSPKVGSKQDTVSKSKPKKEKEKA